MAITLADFTKIWASTSPLTPYSFTESNYKEGWNFIGGTPPSRQMWDSIQNQNDEKLKYIVDNFLPKAGGTMTGAIVLADGGNPLSTAGGTMTGGIEYKGTNNEPFFFGSYGDGATFGWDFNSATGSGIGLYNVSRSTDKGAFVVWAKDGSNSASLTGKPNGSLVWNNNPVGIIGNLANGHGILTGHKDNISVPANSYVQGTISFGQTFSSVPMVVVCGGMGHAHIHASCSNISTTGFTYTVSSEGPDFTNERVNWIAIG